MRVNISAKFDGEESLTGFICTINTRKDFNHLVDIVLKSHGKKIKDLVYMSLHKIDPSGRDSV